MAKSDPIPQNEEEDEDEDAEALPPPPPRTREAQLRLEKAKLENVFRRLQSGKVPIRVHDVIVEGNTKTKDSVIEAEIALLKEVSSMQELMEVSKLINFKLQSLDIFDSVKITLDSGPPELPGTANVVIEVVETKRPLTGEVGVYTKG